MLKILENTFFEKLIVFLLPVSFLLGFKKEIFSFDLGASEYSKIFFYPSSLIIFLFIVFCLLKFGKNLKDFILRNKTSLYFLKAFLFFILISVFLSQNFYLSTSVFIRLAFQIIFSLSLALYFFLARTSYRRFFSSLFFWGFFESLIGIYQFMLQKSVGLRFLGEAIIAPFLKGIGKVDFLTTKLVRSYGTFPHPNILSAFLLVSLISGFYLWISERSSFNNTTVTGLIKRYILFIVPIFSIILAIFLSFSRSAWLATILFPLIFVIYQFTHQTSKIESKKIFQFIAIMCLSGLITVLIFKPLTTNRLNVSYADPAVNLRLTYSKIGIEIIKNNFFGVGLGNQINYSISNGVFKKFGLNEIWQYEPIHNIYLLIASEVGILSLVFILCFILITISKIKSLLFNLIIATPILILMFLGVFDHFLWDIWQGQLLFWASIGLVWGFNPSIQEDKNT